MSAESEFRRLAMGCLLAGFVGTTPPDWLLRALDDGLAGVVLFGSNLGTDDEVRLLCDRLHASAGRDLVIALDEEGGDVARLGRRGIDGPAGTGPGAAALGRLDDPGTTEAVHAQIAARLLAAGITMDLAPVADVNSDPANPVIGVRSAGADPAVVARYVAAAVRGLQSGGIAACVKHFPGHGATSNDSHHEVATVTRTHEQLLAEDFLPFRAGIDAGARAVMTGHLSVPALDATAVATVSAAITTGELRDRLGFTGAVVTDALEMRAIADTIGIVDGFVGALAAGADCIETGAVEHVAAIAAIPGAVSDAVRSGRLSEERLASAADATRSLAQPGAAPDPSPAQRERVEASYRDAVEVVGHLPELVRPLVIECRTPNGVATGDRHWSLAEAVAARTADTQAMPVLGPLPVSESERLAAARRQGRTVVLVVRDPHRHRWQFDVAATVLSAHGDNTVLIDVGWPVVVPAGATEPAAVLRTRGIAPDLLDAAADLLAAHRVRQELV